MENFLIFAVLAAIIGFAARYVHKSGKTGGKCIGCPDGASCPYKTSGKGCCGSQAKS